MIEKHLHILIAKDHYNALDLIRSLGEKNLNVVYISIKGKCEITSKSKYIKEIYFTDTIEEAYNILLKNYSNYNEKPFLYCTDDYSMSYIDYHYSELKDKFIFFNAKENGKINKYLNKSELYSLAKKCGISYLKSWKCRINEIPKDIEYPIITKAECPTIGAWKADVFICKNENELIDAYKKIKSPIVIIQKFIDKKNELEFYGYSINDGNDVQFTIAANYLYLIPGYYSPYMNIFSPPYPELQNKIKLMFKEIKFNGIFSVEFIVDKDDNLYFLEINLRNATWSYSSTAANMNIPYLWANDTLNKKLTSINADFKPFKAMVEPVDYAKRVDTGKITKEEWLADFKDAKCTYYYNKNDREPFFEMMKNFNKLK